MSKAKRTVMNIEMPPDAMKVLDAECERTGMAKREFVSRVFRWWAEQDDVIRGSILEHLPASVRVDVARVVLERMAHEKPVAPAAVDLAFVNRKSPGANPTSARLKEPPAGSTPR